MNTKNKVIAGLTLLLSGRAMTLWFLGRAGGEMPGDPPAVWLMPLLGDAIIGVSAFAVAYLVLKRTGLGVWLTIVVWNVIAIWDALSAYLIHLSAPWPEFFMTQIFGSSMFFMAAGMHAIILLLSFSKEVKAHFLIP